MTSLVAQMVKHLPTMRETGVQSLGWEDLLEKETSSSIIAWKIQWTEEPGRLRSVGLQTVGHDWTTSLSISLCKCTTWVARPGADCGSDNELLITKFRLKLKKVGKTSRPSRYDINQIPYDYTVEVRNRFKGLDLIDRVPDELWN